MPPPKKEHVVNLRRLTTLVVAVAALAVPTFAAENFDIDGDHSQVIFKVNHLGVSNNYGRFNNIAGTFVLDGANSKIDITIKADSVDTHHGKRDQHLMSPDFLNAKQFPTLTFKSKSVKMSGEKAMEVSGELTFLGVTKPLTLKVTQVGAGSDPWGGYRAGFETSFTIKRSDFGNKFMIPAVGDDIALMVNIEGVRK